MESPQPKNARECDEKKFALKSEISEEDLFSNLSYDCLLEMFSWFDHASLDATATVSQRLHAFSSQARPNASKGVVDIQIARTNPDEYTATLIYCDGWAMSKTFSDNGLHGGCADCSDMVELRNLLQLARTNSNIAAMHKMFAALQSLEKRYFFKTIIFDKITFDQIIITFCTRFINVKQTTKRVFNNIAFYTRIRAATHRPTAQKFRKFIFEGGPNEIQIRTSENLEHLNVISLMDSYSNTVSSPSLTICSSLDPPQVEKLDDVWAKRYTIKNWRSRFVNFIDLRLNYVVVPINTIMRLILARYRQQKAGQWYLNTNRCISHKVITAGLHKGKMCVLCVADGSMQIMLEGNAIVSIKTFNRVFRMGTDQSYYPNEITFY